MHVVLDGLKGLMTVKGQKFNGVMPPLDPLSDAEIAAVDAAAVAAARKKPMNPDAVHAFRESHH